MKKKIISLILTISMILSFVTLNTRAFEIQGTIWSNSMNSFYFSGEGQIQHFEFMPDMEGEYYFYSMGDLGMVSATLYDEWGNYIASDSGSYDGMNFSLYGYCSMGMRYILEVSTQSSGMVDIYADYYGGPGPGPGPDMRWEDWGEIGTGYYYLSSYTHFDAVFRVPESGVYKIIAPHNDDGMYLMFGMEDMLWTTDIYDHDYCRNINIQYFYAREYEECYIMGDNPSWSGMEFTIEKVEEPEPQMLGMNNSISLDGAEFAYVSFIPENDGEVLVNSSSNIDFELCYFDNRERWYAEANNTIMREVIAGEKYYIITRGSEGETITARMVNDVELTGVTIDVENVVGGKNVVLTTEDNGAQIYYSTDGNDFNVYSEPVFFEESGKIYTYSEVGVNKSETASQDIVVEQLEGPVAKSTSGAYLKDYEIVFEASNPLEKIYYSINNETKLYEGPIFLVEDVEITVWSVCEGYKNSPEKTYTYYVVDKTPPVIKLEDIKGGKQVSFEKHTDHGKIFVAVNATEYSEYSDAINIYENSSISAYIMYDGDCMSEVLNYSIDLEKSAMPMANPVQGGVFKNTEITLSSIDEDAVIYYTTDGTDPSEMSELYKTPITVSDEMTIKAVAYSMGKLKSDVATFEYTIMKEDLPLIQEELVMGGKNVIIVSVRENAEIMYSIDGGTNYIKYNNPIYTDRNVTVNAYVIVDGNNSDVVTKEIVVPKASVPVAEKSSGVYEKGTQIKLSTQEENTMIEFSYNGTDSYRYTEPFILEDDLSMSVWAIGMGIAKSDEVKLSYSLIKAPEFSQNDIYGGRSVSISTLTNGADIYVSVNDGEYQKYSNPLNIYKQSVIKAYSQYGEDVKSDIKSVEINLDKAIAPVAKPEAGEVYYGTMLEFSADNDDKQTRIYYTTDLKEPDSTSPFYEKPIELTEDITFKAITYAMGLFPSDPVEFDYKVKYVPVPVIADEAVRGGKNITITHEIADAKIFYSTDNETFVEYKEPVLTEKTLQIYAYATVGAAKSETITVTLNVPKAKTPVSSQPSGRYGEGTLISFTSDENAEIIYTVNGIEHTYTQALELTENIEFKVYAIGKGIAKSDEVVYTYTVYKSVPPTFSEIDVMGGKEVLMKTASENGVIYYSVDGGEFVQYTDPVHFSDIAKIEAYTKLEGAKDSAHSKYDVFMTQTMAPNPNYASQDVKIGTDITLESVNDDRETKIYYTLDGITIPDNKSTLYESPIIVKGEVTIKAIAYSVGQAPSEVVTLKYTIRKAKTPQITEENARGGKKITMRSETADARIYYTVNGDEPTINSNQYTQPFIVGISGTQVKAIAVAEDYLESDVASMTVEIGRLPSPIVTPNDDTIYKNTQIEINAESYADVYYTTDGSDPNENSKKYTGSFTVDKKCVVKAIAVSEGWQTSEIAQKEYNIFVTSKPYITKTKVSDSWMVEIKSETKDAQIYYTVDGTIPSVNSFRYSQPITVSRDTTITAYAVSSGRLDSEYMSETVLVKHTENPFSNIASGEISLTDKIVLSSTKPDAKIYYTTDNTEPTEASKLYTEPFVLSGDTVLKIIAVEDGFLNSSVVTYEYTIKRVINPDIEFGDDIMGGKTVVISSKTENAKIYYTIDGSSPISSGILYNKPIELKETTNIRACAVADDYLDSEIVEREMVVPVAYINKPISSYVVKIGSTVDIDISTPENFVYYETGLGNVPTLESGVYKKGTIEVGDEIYIKAFAIGMGYAKSEIITYNFVVGTSKVSIETSRKEDCVLVKLKPTYDQTKIKYTIDNTNPETSDTAIEYIEPFNLYENCRLRLYAECEGYKAYEISKDINIRQAKKPSIKAEGIYYKGFTQSVDLFSITKGGEFTLVSQSECTIRYTLDGSDPKSEKAIVYKGEKIRVDDKMTLKAICSMDGYADSDVFYCHINILDLVADVEVTDIIGGKCVDIIPRMGNYGYKEQLSSISSKFDNYTVYYTLDGTNPTIDSPIYKKVSDGESEVSKQGGLFVNKDTTVKTKIVVEGYEETTSQLDAEEIIEVKKQGQPSILPLQNIITKIDKITIETSDEKPLIYYTLDGTKPVDDDGVPTDEALKYEEPFALTDDAVVNAVVTGVGKATGDVRSFAYTLKRAEIPEYSEKMTAGGMVITLSSKTENAQIYYTLDGSEPTVDSILYEGPFKLKENRLLKAVSVNEVYKESYPLEKLVEVPFAQLSAIMLDDKSVAAGSLIEVPVKIQNNPGIAAYSLSIHYDNAELTPVLVNNNWGGLFTTNLDKGENSGIEDAVSITWIGVVNNYSDGDIATIVFKANERSAGKKTNLYIKENGVINNLFETADVCYMNSTVDIDTATIALMNVSANAQVYEERTPNTANISVLSEKVNDNTMLVSVLSESYTGVGAYNVTLSYDNEAVTPVSVKNGDLFESDVISNLDQSGVNVNELNEIKVLSFNDTDKVGEGVLFTVEFKINDEEKVTDVEITDALILTSSGDEVDFEFSETKVQAEMTVTELVLVDASGNLGKYTIEVDSNCTTDATIVVAAYNEMGKLIDMNSKDISLNKGENSFDGIPLKIKSGSENPYIVVYLWDSLSNMTPLAESVMVPVAEVVCNLAVAAIPRINSGDVVQNIKYQIQSTGETDATVITAIYNDDGRLLNSSINEVSLQFGSNTVSGISIPLEGEYVRPYMMVYLWNNIYDMIPIISPKKSYIR